MTTAQRRFLEAAKLYNDALMAMNGREYRRVIVNGWVDNSGDITPAGRDALSVGETEHG